MQLLFAGLEKCNGLFLSNFIPFTSTLLNDSLIENRSLGREKERERERKESENKGRGVMHRVTANI